MTKKTINSPETTERPILFQTAMVQAILNRFKTVTRRTKGLEPFNKFPNRWILDGAQLMGQYIFHHKTSRNEYWINCPYGKVGDILWVRESFSPHTAYPEEACQFLYRADISDEELPQYSGSWKPNIHMPKKACRLQLLITNIRIERLKNITEQSAMAEGIKILPFTDGKKYQDYFKGPQITRKQLSPIGSFKSLWESINGEKLPWKKNPWVWVITFEQIKS